ncbi:SusC/RagA family TonB-linked outer membrane protein [Albibacterium profundi]|uniref:SusC/RagA family TonB-linked outer membrane protein n=1 Tax=Albibacterium profundi TaxID=3134906 RepID=A0ABV5CCZ9_9SPHI
MNNFYRLTCSLLFFCLLNLSLYGQKIISGEVIDREANLPLPGVSVLTGSPSKGIAVTNADGSFTVSVPVGAELTFKFIGFENTVEIIDDEVDRLTVYMDVESNVMQEAVVVGYQQRTRETMTGSSVVISGKELQNVPVANVMELLQGKVAGLNIQNNVGSPGMRGSTVIRGISNINVTGAGNDAYLTPTAPLFVIDGVPVDDNVNYQYGFEQAGPGISPLSLIPSEDIEQIEVLKDAQATSLYGSRGAYGVILVTTKRGKSKIPIIQYTSNFFVSTPPQLREVIGGKEERMLRINQILQNDTSYYNALDLVNKTSFLADSLNPYYNNSTNWQSYFYRTTYNQTHNVNISGGDQLFNYKVNTGYYDEKGIIENTGFTRYSLNMNMQYQPTNRFKLFAAINSAVGNNSKGSGNSLKQTGVAGGGAASSLLPSPSLYTASNELLGALSVKNENKTTNISTNLELQYEPIQGLRGTTTFSYTYNTATEDSFKPSALNNNFSEVYAYNDRRSSLYNRNMISYVKSWQDKHTFSIYAFNELNLTDFRADVILNKRTPSDQIQGPLGYDWFNSRGGTLNNLTDARSVAFAGSASYNYDLKYVVDLSYRFDGSSTNGPESPYSKNPSVAVRWNFYRENFLENADWLDYGSIRLSWGKNIVPTGSIYDVYGKYVGNVTNYNNNPTVALDLGAIPNTSLLPSTTTQWNGGFDLGFLGGKYNITFDTYYKQVDALLRQKEIANHNAFGGISTNETSMVNYGYELSFTVRPLNASSPVQWTVSANGALNKDVMASLPDGVRQLLLEDNTATNQAILYRLGINSLSNVLLHNKGVFVTDQGVPVDPLTGLRYRSSVSTEEGSYYRAGDPYFTDLNGDYILDENDYVIVGNSQPKVTGGISSFLQYKNWSMNLNFSYTLYRDVLNNALAQRFQNFANPLNMGALVPVEEMDYWRNPGDQAMYPNPYDYTRYNYYQPYRYDQTLFQEDGSYFKINQITLSYNLDRNFTQQYGISSIRLYGTAYNVYTFSNYSGPDPELVTALGRDSSGGYPNKRSYTLGLQVQF